MACNPTGTGYVVCTQSVAWMEFPARAAAAPASASGQFGDNVSALTQSVTNEQRAALAAASAEDYDSADDAAISVTLAPLGDSTYAATATDSDGDSGSDDTVSVSPDGNSWSDTGMNWSGPDVYMNGGVTNYWTTPAVSGYS